MIFIDQRILGKKPKKFFPFILTFFFACFEHLNFFKANKKKKLQSRKIPHTQSCEMICSSTNDILPTTDTLFFMTAQFAVTQKGQEKESKARL
jgi:hypothetical protein